MGAGINNENDPFPMKSSMITKAQSDLFLSTPTAFCCSHTSSFSCSEMMESPHIGSQHLGLFTRHFIYCQGSSSHLSTFNPKPPSSAPCCSPPIPKPPSSLSLTPRSVGALQHHLKPDLNLIQLLILTPTGCLLFLHQLTGITALFLSSPFLSRPPLKPLLTYSPSDQLVSKSKPGRCCTQELSLKTFIDSFFLGTGALGPIWEYFPTHPTISGQHLFLFLLITTQFFEDTISLQILQCSSKFVLFRTRVKGSFI